MVMTKLNRSTPQQISAIGEIPNVAKFIESAAEEFLVQTAWLDLQRLYDALPSDSESLVFQIDDDLDWLSTKLEKAQKYRRTAKIVDFERKLVRQLTKLNQYTAGFERADYHFDGLREAFSTFNLYQYARAIRSAKRKWKKLEKQLLKNPDGQKYRSNLTE
jgi:hypothetical protein